MMDFEKLDFSKLNNSNEIQEFLEFLFDNPSYLDDETKSDQVHKLLIKIVGNNEYHLLQEYIISKIVQDGFNDFNVIQKVYYLKDIHDFNKDSLIINFVIRLLTDDKNIINLKKFKDNSLLYFRKRCSSMPLNYEFHDAHNILIWYVLAHKELLDKDDFESIIPILIENGEFPLPKKENEIFFNKFFKLFFVKVANLSADQENYPIVASVIKEKLQSSFSRQTEKLILVNESLKLLKILDFYLMLIQVYPLSFSCDLFKSIFFLNFLDENVKLLIKALSNNADNSYDEHLKTITIFLLLIFEKLSVDESVAKIIIEKYLRLVLKLSDLESKIDSSISALSALVLVKCWNTYRKLINAEKFHENKVKIQEIDESENLDSTTIPVVTLDKLFSTLIHVLSTSGSQDGNIITSDKYCIEGLAFLSLNIRFRKLIRSNSKVVKKIEVIYTNEIKKLLNMRDVDSTDIEMSSELVYGILTIFANCSTFNTKRSKEEESIEYLRKYSLNSITRADQKEIIGDQSTNCDNSDNDDDINNFINNNIDDWPGSLFSINKIFLRFTKNIQDLIIRIVYNISLQRAYRTQLVKMGCLNLVLGYLIKDDQYYEKILKVPHEAKSHVYSNVFRLFAIRALAKILISNNPNLIFNKYSASAPVLYLVEFIATDEQENTDSLSKFISGLVKPLDTLESLLSLTNLASMDDFKLKEIIFKKTWNYLEGLVLHNNELISQASLELISNLVYYPECASMFFNPENKRSHERLLILIKLMNSQNINIQIIATTIIINGSEYELIANDLYKNEELFHKIIEILNNVDVYFFKNGEEEEDSKVNDLLLRIFYLVHNIIEASETDHSKNDVKINIINNYNIVKDGTLTLKTGINKCLNCINDEETMALVIGISKFLHYA